MYVLNLGTYLPRQCGIATFSTDLRRALCLQGLNVDILAISDNLDSYSYPLECCVELDQEQREDYRTVADYINHSRAQLLIVQHEYGIYGGEDGEYLLDLLEALEKPYLLICHTILSRPSLHQKEVLLRACQRAAGIVCMTARSARLLTDLYEAPSDFVRVIPHGVPLFRARSQQRLKEQYGLEGRQVISTFGLIGPGKGLEIGLRTIAKIKPAHPDIMYLILGQTHPVLVRREGESYREGLEALVQDLGVDEQVRFVNRFLSDKDLGDYLYMTDIYFSPYPNMEQSVSGTMAFAVGCGRAIVSTAYAYAQEVLSNGRGLLASRAEPDLLAELVESILQNPELKQQLQRRTAAFSHSWPWLAVGGEYASFVHSILADDSASLKDERVMSIAER